MDNIKLPDLPEFKSGNDVPVERATLTKERVDEIRREAVLMDREAIGAGGVGGERMMDHIRDTASAETSQTVLTEYQIFNCFDCHCAEMVINFDGDELYPVGRAIEQAVLQSPEIKQIREDAARYRWLRKFPNNLDATVYGVNGCPERTLKRDQYLDAAIDAARGREVE